MGTAAAAGDGGQGPGPSLFCGDAIRDPVLEECDDGPGDEADSCSADCRAHNVAVVPASPGGNDASLARTLGAGAHPLAGGNGGSLVAFVETELSESRLLAQRLNRYGQKLGSPLDLGEGASPSEFANPVAISLPDGRYAVAWNDLGGGSLDVALRTISADGQVGEVTYANSHRPGAQRDADLLWTGTKIVAAWTDLFSVQLRTFSESLSAGEPEQPQSTDELAGRVALCAHERGWAAAFRVSVDGLESVQVNVGDMSFLAGPHAPTADDETPTVVSLDPTHLLLVYSASTDPGGLGTPSTPRLFAALLDTGAPGATDAVPVPRFMEPYASDESLSQRHPRLAKAAGRVYLATQTDSPVGDGMGQELWLQQIAWDGGSLSFLPEIPLSIDADGLGDQVAPAIGFAPLAHEAALVTAWENVAPLNDEGAAPDLVFGLRPVPLVALSPE